MTAPVLHHYRNGERPLLRGSTLYKIGPAFGSARWRLSTGQPRSARGDLWEREAERDVQAHGEPAPATISARLPRGRFAWNHRPGEVRAFVAEQIERRRPEMRLARTTNEGKH